MGKAARAMKRRQGMDSRKTMVKQMRQARRAAMAGKQQPPQRQISLASMRDRVIEEGSIVVGPDGEKKPLLPERPDADREAARAAAEELRTPRAVAILDAGGHEVSRNVLRQAPKEILFNFRGTQTGRFVGKDIPAKAGDVVRAVADGVVDEAGPAQGDR